MTYWQNLLSGVLGLWIILVVILGFSSTLSGFFLIVSGLGIAVLGFWTAYLTKPARNASRSEAGGQFLENPNQPDQNEINPGNGGENNA